MQILEGGKYDFVVIKLDIEGGEYAVLDSLVSRNLLHHFNMIYVEFHSQYMSDEFSEKYRYKEKSYFDEAKKSKTGIIKWI